MRNPFISSNSACDAAAACSQTVYSFRRWQLIMQADVTNLPHRCFFSLSWTVLWWPASLTVKLADGQAFDQGSGFRDPTLPPQPLGLGPVLSITARVSLADSIKSVQLTSNRILIRHIP